MANNTQVNNGTGDFIRDIDRSGVKTQVAGIDTDVGGATEKLLGPLNPMPIGNFATVSGTFSASDAVGGVPAGTGALTNAASTAGSVISLAVPQGMSSWTAMIKGYATGTIYSEASQNSTNGTDGDWIEVKGRLTGSAPGIDTVTYAYTQNGYYRGVIAGFTYFRLRLIGTGTPNVIINVNSAPGATFLNSSIPGGTNSIGTVVLGAGSAAAGSVTIGAALPAGAATIGNVGLVAGAAAIGTVALNAAIPAGANAIGTVAINAALPAGANQIGTVGLVAGAAAIGSVTLGAALPAGTNNIGIVSVRGAPVTGQTLNVAAATPVTGTGLDVSTAGNVTFIVKNTVAATAFTGAPVIVFEQSDDNVSWSPLQVVRSDTNAVASTVTLPAGTANGEIMLDAGMEGVNWVRARVTTAQTANGMTIVITPGGLPFSPYVSVGALPALTTGTADIGNVIVRNNQLEYEQDVPGLDTVAYTSGDQFGTVITIANAARFTGGTGFINGIMYHDNEAKLGAMDILIFNDIPTLAANNAAFSIAVTESRKLLWVGNLTYLLGTGVGRYGQLQGISIPYFCTGTSLYATIITRISPAALTTPASTQRIRFLLSRD